MPVSLCKNMNLPKSRVFIAFPISESLKEVILVWQKKFPEIPVRWTKKDNIHITIVPPWEESELGEVINQLKTLEGKYGAGTFSAHTITYGPSERNPRLIWAQGEVDQKFHTFKIDLEKLLSRAPGRTTWRPHITLARFAEEDFKHLSVQNINESISLQEELKSFVIMESRQTQQGMDYVILETFKL